MTRGPIIAVADDLTGAAEIAALGFRHGLDSVVVTSGGAMAVPAQLIVHDTDSRLDSSGVAAAKVAAIGQAFAGQNAALIYKKTDSVLRGPVRSEVEALARALGRPRAILLPANPSMGRTIHDGQYAINRVPLDQTPFARDPHHPAKSASVLRLLGDDGAIPIAVKSAADSLPSEGLVIGNAEFAADALAWARQVTARDLPAGGAEFFAALLSQQGLKLRTTTATFAPRTPTLIVSGTTSSASGLRERARRDGIAILPLPREVAEPATDATAAVTAWIDAVRALLAADGVALVLHDGPLVPGPVVAAAIRGALARAVQALVQSDGLRHVIVEGGATAASIARAVDWNQLRLVREWAQGVASLQPVGTMSVELTMKPGSYAWPEELWTQILRSRLRA